MSNDSPLQPPPSRNGPPHIRLNSGTEDLIADSPDARPPTAPAPGRSLTRPGPSPTISQQHSTSSLRNVYSQKGAESAELLLPPKKSRSRRFRDEESPTPTVSGISSRRTSWSSDGSSRDSRNPFVSPFDDSRAPSRAGSSDDEYVNTQTVSEKYNILPSAGLLLFPEDIEKDDYLHNPSPEDKDRDCDIFSRRGLLNVGGLAFITIGLLVLFIGYPIATFVQTYTNPGGNSCSSDPLCISDKMPLLTNVRRALIDPDTPESAMSKKSPHTGKTQVLVYSDEFNKDGRTFYDGDDPYWTAVDIWYGVTADLEWYDPDAVTTENGTLAIRFDAFQNHNLNYRSGMIQSWNQNCFKGGRMEASISLPGRGDTIGFWPGFWSMGNLGRPGYAATTDGMWPYSYDDVCDAGITPNQSDPSGLNFLPGMKMPACTCKGEDHPNPGKSRSSPEIDALEASVGYLDPPIGAAVGSASQSCQVGPFDLMWRPDFDFVEVYDHSVTLMNAYQGGVYQQAISGVTNLNNNWYDGKQYQTYAFEYEPGNTGYVTWYIGDTTTWTLDHRALGPNGNIAQRIIPAEPMAMIVNFGMSSGFAALNMTGLGPLMPATMRVDYIRIYQDEDNVIMTCDPPGYPTTEYIAAHPEPYHNPNMTIWSQTGYDWPKNSFMNGCTA